MQNEKIKFYVHLKVLLYWILKALPRAWCFVTYTAYWTFCYFVTLLITSLIFLLIYLRSLDLLHFYIFISFVHAFSVSYAWTCNIITNALYFPCLFEQWTEYQMSHVLLAISAYIWYSFYDRIKLPFKLNDRWDKYSKIPLAVKKTEACF